jgi:hypothetical protein
MAPEPRVAHREWPGWYPGTIISIENAGSAVSSTCPSAPLMLPNPIGDTWCRRLLNASYMPMYCPSSDLK